mmetsp:Transcript_15104/g.37885  ORF Transcript_15104/g.37885 Transcript_15104/m.37885 type:complete len:193 (-) Transcript_15104:1399-1977(-)|eukprot:jgi/Tetstr1/440130/TSEL_028487.t1
MSGLELPPSLLCPITHELLQSPVIGSDGYTYERSAIEDWLQRHGHSPLTRQPMELADLRPNRAVADQVEWFLQQHGASGAGPASGCAPSAPPLPYVELHSFDAPSSARPPQPFTTPAAQAPPGRCYPQLQPQRAPGEGEVPTQLRQKSRQQHRPRKRHGHGEKLLAGRVYGDTVEVTGVYQDRLREKDCAIM